MSKKKVTTIEERDRIAHDGVQLRGFYRLQIEDGPTGEIVGDSGWLQNTVTNDGKLCYLVRAMASSAGSQFPAYAALGEGSAPNASHTSLENEVVGTSGEQVRNAVAAESSGSTALRFTGTFDSDDSFVTATESISNIGLYALSTEGTLFAGNTFASSTCAVNQNVNYTYDITLT